MKSLAAWGLAFSLMASAPAWAQMDSREGIALQNQILELRRDMQQMRNDSGRAPAPQSTYGSRPAPSAGGSDISVQLLERVDRLEDSVRQLNGRMDEMNNTLNRQNADLAKQIGDLQFKIDNSGAGAGAGASAGAAASLPLLPPTARQPSTSPAASSQAPTPLGTLPVNPPAAVKRTPELALQDGNAALARRDYPAAEAGAREVLAGGKTAPRAYDADFLLAQAMLGQRNYPQAAIAYGDTYDRAKTGTHAQDSLVGLAFSLNAINEKRSACAALDTLRTQFPTPRQDVLARAVALRTTAGCK